MHDFTVRPAAPDDLPAILEISNHYALTTPANFAIEPETMESWRESYRATHEKFPWFVAVDSSATDDAPGGTVIGFSKASPWKGRCAYDWSAEVTVYLKAGHQRRGIGRALYQALIDTMRAQGFRSIVGGITLPNEASVRLHESFGFRPIGRFERIGYKFEKWHDVGYWELQLQDDDAPPNPIRPVQEVLANRTNS